MMQSCAPDTDIATTLSPQQVAQFHEDGYLLVPRLVPEPISVKAETAMWRCIGVDPADPPASWENVPGGFHLYNAPEIADCYTPRYMAGLAQLTGDDVSTFSKCATHPVTYSAPDFLQAQAAGEDLTRFFKWHCVSTITILPTKGAWKHQPPHIDHGVNKHHKTFPPVFRIGSLTYLSNVERSGGGTFVWPASHLQVEALARSDPERYAYRHTLNGDLRLLSLGDPIELSPERGSVLFLHHFLAHAGSLNVSRRPRFAIGMKW